MSEPDDTSLAKIELLILDVDGVLTDGRLYYGPDGEALKAFHVKDGLGIKLLQREGIMVSVITAKTGGPLAKRLADLGVSHKKMGREDKAAALAELLEELELDPSVVAHVGDDLPDVGVMRQVGISIAVADAHPFVIEHAHHVTDRLGGRGAVREIADAILTARGVLSDAIERYLSSH